MKTQHTPGPWRYSEKHHAIVADCFPDWADPSDPDQEKVTKVCTLMGALGGHNPDADKAVMIAAPDLLNLLTAADRLETLTGENLAVYARTFAALARAAIARATGGNAS